MKSLIIFYSYDGNCRLVADWIRTITDSDVLELIPVDNRQRSGLSKYFWGGKQVVRNMEPELLDYNVQLSDYDLIFIGTPVWAGGFAPALNTFFAKTAVQGKKIALFCCHGGGKGKVFDKMKARLEGNSFIGELDLLTPAWKNTEQMYEKVVNWIEKLSEVNAS